MVRTPYVWLRALLTLYSNFSQLRGLFTEGVHQRYCEPIVPAQQKHPYWPGAISSTMNVQSESSAAVK